MTADITSIDGIGPLPIHRPRTPEEIGDLVRTARGENQALFPVGAGTQLGLGSPPIRPGWIVDLRSLDGILDYPARDMTITVQAGIPMARLQDLLAKENQRLPIDVPRAAEATLGGIIAANVSGPRRFGFGTLRDYVIGISAINDEGEVFKAGGRVVKNVAGYDLCKLLVGSLGTLGIITQVTLKLRPLAENSIIVALSVPHARLAEALDRLHATRTRPVAVDLVDSVFPSFLPGTTDDWTLLVGFEGNQESVQWQVRQLVEESRGLGQAHPLEAEKSREAWQRLIEPPAHSCAFKTNLLPSGVAAFCSAMKSGDVAIRAHAASGIVLGYARVGLTAEHAASMLNKWRQHAAGHQGKVIVLNAPPEWKATLNVWGPDEGDTWLMREVKNKLDPHNVFNPGRFVGGI